MTRKKVMRIVALMAFLSGLSSAQTVAPETVFVPVLVTASDKTPVSGLKTENFQVSEDGVEQKVSYFSNADGPWELDIVIKADMLHPGRADQTSAAIRDAVDTFQRTGNPANRYHIDEILLDVEHFTFERLYAAIDRHLMELQKSANSRRALILVTDGSAVHSETFITPQGYPSEILLKSSRSFNIPIYFLYLYRESAALECAADPVRCFVNPKADGDNLAKIAIQSGGKFFYVEPLHQFQARLKEIGEELKNEYVIGFKSTNTAKNDKWRTLKIKVNAPSGIKVDVTAKGKYFVPKLPPG